MRNSWLKKYAGEAVGTFLLVLFGCSAVVIAVTYGHAADLFSAGLAWGFSVALAVWVTGSISGAHLNPAVTLGFAIIGRHPWRKVIPYWTAQVMGAFGGAAAVVLVFGDAIRDFALRKGIEMGAIGSEKIAMMLAPYSPHPGIVGIDVHAYAIVPVWRGFATELLGTALLAIVVLVLTEARNENSPAPWGLPIGIVILVTMLTVVTGAHTMTSLNPARDLGPRIMLAFMGFGSVAFPGPRDGLSMFITIGGPLAGGVIGCLLYKFGLARLFARPLPESEQSNLIEPNHGDQVRNHTA
ncbi:MIP/aquaporin family protein [Paenibacillus sp. GCM10027626]|uniref:MIP/aquaporin family protein n=1 Tax=Paenibacillus sp. GCM10027626 TaxID=3273411 RepID=UPI003645CDF4